MPSIKPQLRHTFRPAGAAAMLMTLALSASSFIASTAWAETPPWQDAPFTLMSGDQTIARALSGFAQTFGLELSIAEGVAGHLPAGSGRFAAQTPTEFLDRFCAVNGLVWYYHAGRLYISAISQRVSRPIGMRGISGATLKRTLADMGVLEAKFGWSELDDRGVVIVTGPPGYVDRIERTLDTFSEPLAEQELQVYRLRHASVEDRTISYREQSTTTPGVATILRNLVVGEGTLSSGASEVRELAGRLNPLTPMGSSREPGAASQGQDKVSAGSPNPGSLSSAVAPRQTGASTMRPSVQADPRLNAVIVRDRPQNAPIYKRLIELLDVPSELIEIEAIIVDINSSSVAELGVDWAARMGNVALTFGQPVEAARASSVGLSTGSAAGQAAVIPATGDFLMARIRALEGKGNARVVSRPSILTQDNLGALIDLSDTFYIQTVGERVANVTPVSVGVSLRVTPRVVHDGAQRSVQLVVDIEDGTVLESTIGALPTVRRSTIGTQALMRENEALVIGGFNAEQTSRARENVPLLGDLPMFGALFGKTLRRDEKRERLFLLVPRVVSGAAASRARVTGAAATVVQRVDEETAARRTSSTPAPVPVAVPAGPEPTPASPVQGVPVDR